MWKPISIFVGQRFAFAETAGKTVHFFADLYAALSASPMSIATLNDIFFAAVERKLDRIMLHRQSGEWLPISSQEFGRNVDRTAHGLQEWGIRQGDRVAILSENRPEWPAADIATLLLGAVTVPLYTTLTPEQTAFVLQDAGCRVIFLSSDQQLN